MIVRISSRSELLEREASPYGESSKFQVQGSKLLALLAPCSDEPWLSYLMVVARVLAVAEIRDVVFVAALKFVPTACR